MGPVFFLLTDFGLQDPYVGQMKAVIWSKMPEANILDLSHGVRPHNVLQAGFFLAASWPYLPPGSVGLAVVDPGVGTSRPILLCRQNTTYALAPDNGLLSLLLDREADCRVWRMHPSIPDQEVSSTFHGRDLFAPVACQLANGCHPSQLGTEIGTEDCRHPMFRPPCREGSRIETRVVHIDHFGNCLLSLEAERWSGCFPAGRSVDLVYPRQASVCRVSTYAQIPQAAVGLLIGSQGFLELACNQTSCAQHMGLDIGDQCTFRL